MKVVSKVLFVCVVLSLGLAGCAPKPAARGESAERVRALEARCVKLEQDYRTAAAARDQVRKQMSTLEEEHARVQKEAAALAVVTKERDQLLRSVKALQAERDELKKQVAERTTEREALEQKVAAQGVEREALQQRVERLKKGLQSLISSDDGQNPAPTNGPAIGGL